MQLVDHQPNSTFTTAELARLATYRAAVLAGFFTDWDGSTATTDTRELAWLPRTDAAGETAGYPFTAEEREHLAGLRARLAAGAYADDQPVVVAPGPDARSAPSGATDEDAAR